MNSRREALYTAEGRHDVAFRPRNEICGGGRCRGVLFQSVIGCEMFF